MLIKRDMSQLIPQTLTCNQKNRAKFKWSVVRFYCCKNGRALSDFVFYRIKLICGCWVRLELSVHDVVNGVTPFVIADALTIAGIVSFTQEL